MTTNKQQATDLLIKVCEGIRLQAYEDSAVPPNATIGIGTTVRPDGSKIQMGDHCTTAEAYVWLNYHLSKHVFPAVDKLCQGHNVPDEVYSALASISYNMGAGILSNASFIEPIQSANWADLATTFRMYCKQRVNGILTVCKGLQNRREIEIANFKPLIKE